jgi:hypothetical protein
MFDKQAIRNGKLAKVRQAFGEGKVIVTERTVELLETVIEPGNRIILEGDNQSCCCDTLIASEEGRLSVSGPEVIETVMGVEAFDSRDRALVWRTTGGKNRFLFGTVTELVEDHIPAFRSAVIRALTAQKRLSLAELKHANLAKNGSRR